MANTFTDFTLLDIIKECNEDIFNLIMAVITSAKDDIVKGYTSTGKEKVKFKDRESAFEFFCNGYYEELTDRDGKSDLQMIIKVYNLDSNRTVDQDKLIKKYLGG